MTMRLVSILGPWALLLAVGGCSSDTVEKMSRMADSACECRDVACAEKAQKEFYEFATANAKAKGTKGDHEEMQGHYDRMNDCLVRVRSAAGVGTPPAEAGEPADKAGDGKEPAQ